MNEQRIPYFIVGAAMIISALVFGSFYYYGQTVSGNDTLSVVGSAKTRVSSDSAKLIISLSRVTTESALSSGYRNLASDLRLAKEMLSKYEVNPQDVSENVVMTNQIYEQNTGSPTRYQLTQTLTVQSDDVQKVTEVSKKITDLSAQGVFVSVQSLEYFYSKLPDLRVSLLTEAVQDAKARAEKIAEGTGRSVGNVQAASSGVVQVLSPNSVDVSDYGNYDTGSIDKDVMVTVKASFRLR